MSAEARSEFRLSGSLARALSGGIVRVGTENRAKLGAVNDALARFVEGDESSAAIQVVPTAVASGVPEQPVGWDEIVTGARNRAQAAFDFGDCTLAVGIEDGLARLSDADGGPSGDLRDYFNVGCAWVTDGDRDGHGFSSGFAYPPASLEPAVGDHAPIGDLFDTLWRRHRGRGSPGSGPATQAPSGRNGGNIGLLTQGRLDRAAYGAQAVICALVRFLHTDLYD
jgi:inosine/xanthosine triphosphatase